MKNYNHFLHSKVGRRFFLLFIYCALIPIGILSFLSFNHVLNQLNKQCRIRLRQATKAVGMGIFERLVFLEAGIKYEAPHFISEVDNETQTTNNLFNSYFENKITAIALNSKNHGMIPFFGQLEDPPELTAKTLEHLRSGDTVLLVKNYFGLPSRIFFVLSLGQQKSEAKTLIAEINNDYLWGIGSLNTLPLMTELCILDQSKNVLFSSLPLPSSFQKQIATASNNSHAHHFKWKNENAKYFAYSWDIFLKSRFYSPMWTIIISRPEFDIHAPIADFKKLFLLVVFMSICVVIFLSSISIRKYLAPLEKLKEGTRRIAEKKFSSRVKITSGDEFEDLGTSFNSMSIQLGRQFNALETLTAISQTILSTLNIDKIAERLLTGIHNIFQCDTVSLSVFDANNINNGVTYVSDMGSEIKKHSEPLSFFPRDVQKFEENPDYCFIDKTNDIPYYLFPVDRKNIQSFLVLPIFIKEKLSGFIAIGFIKPHADIDADPLQGRQLADQVAVALSNSFLVEELNQLNWGTLTALARTVDAKSPWTAGHSERVANLALKIGKFLGLDLKERETIRRAALLHDVGKIGVPVSILDKPGKLTDEEYSVIKNHPELGARILDPIKAYSEVIIMVLQHHERFDGKGYPNGLAGEDISLGGRILAVCDVFDALVSNRPYRSGWEPERAVTLIKQEAGRQFDPIVVKAFLELITEEIQESYQVGLNKPKPPGHPNMVETEFLLDPSIVTHLV